MPSVERDSVMSAEIGGGDAVVIAEGDLDLATAPLLDVAIAGLIAEGHRRLVIDLTDAAFLDSAAIGMLFHAVAPLRDDPESAVLLAGAHGVVARILEVTGIGALFRCCSTCAAAIDALADEQDGWRSVVPRPGLPFAITSLGR